VTPVKVTYEIELEPGEKLELPASLVGSIGPGRWLISVEQVAPQGLPFLRDHSAFLNSYAAEDDSLYDASPGR
jgi:hypothetical protein